MIKRLFPTGGNSSAIVLPKAITKKYDLHPSDYVLLEEKNGVIILKKLVLGDYRNEQKTKDIQSN